MKNLRTILSVALLAVALLLYSNRAWGQQNFAFRNNLVYDIALTPNLGFDARIGEHWTLGLTAGYRPWPTDDNKEKKWRHLLIAPELRYWTDSTFHKSYWGTNLIYSHYNVGNVTFPFGLYKSVRDQRKQGDLAALGLFYGRSWRLNRFLRLEGEVGAAVGYTWSKVYECAHCGAYRGPDNKLVVIPKLTLNLVYQRVPKKPVVVITDTLPVVIEKEEPKLMVRNVPDNTGRAGFLQKDNPVLQHISQYRPYDRTRILRKEKGALYVHFPLSSGELRHDFRNNGEVLDRIINITQQVMADTTSSVRCIQIVGLASVEGPLQGNERLSTLRAEALKSYIQERVAAPDSLFDVAYGGEAWAELRDQVNDIILAATVPADTLTALKEVLNLIDTEADLNRREQRMRQLDKGRTYQYIRQHLLADQRNSGYLRIFFDYVPDTAAATINQASDLIRQEKYVEALRLLQGVRHDPRSWNALGVALHFTGQPTAALDYFRRAAQQGNADAIENLKQLKGERP